MSKNMENIRRQAMENSEELQDFLRDLGNWEQEIKKKDEQLRKETHEPSVPAEKIKSPSKQEENKQAEEKEEDDDDDCSSSADEENGDDEEITGQQLKQKALFEKDRGNKFFSEGKYDDAIACYTSGIQADPTNAVLPANRAMALIKKGQLAAAEQDCTLSISLDYTYAKAFHRRGTCRFALKKLALARQDFLKVMELEPGNKFAKVELEKLEQEFRRRDVAKTDPVNSKTSSNMLTTGESSESAPKPLNSRLQDPTIFTGGLISKQQSVEDNQSSLGIKHKESGGSSNANVELKKKSFFSDLPDQVKPVYKAGHLRSKSALQRIAIEVHSSDEDSEEPTIVLPVHRPTWLPTSTTNKSKISPKPSPSTPVLTPLTPQSLPDVPQTAFQFETDWRRLRHWPQFKVQYLKNIRPESLQHMYQQSMETEIFIDILRCIQEFSNENKQLALEYLKSLTQIGRFSTTVLFLSAAETQIVKDILTVVSSVASSEEIKSLQLLFQI